MDLSARNIYLVDIRLRALSLMLEISYQFLPFQILLQQLFINHWEMDLTIQLIQSYSHKKLTQFHRVKEVLNNFSKNYRAI